MNKNLLIIVISLFAVFGLFSAGQILAGTTDNVSGYAWSSNIGWVSFNCTDRGTCAANPYGVHINADGTFTGYAWSENIGWIHFAPLGPYPTAPDHSVRVDTVNGQVSGWARALNHGDGWDGWIRMRDGNYGVSINFINGQFSGFAWGGLNIGWLNFRGANYGVITSFTPTAPPPPPIISNSVSGWAWSSNVGWISFNCTNQGTCGTNPYGVNVNADGTFTGYAWSSNVGWIHFAPTDPGPVAPTHSVRVDTANGQVSGWARALSHGDNWDGWIRMRGANYGVSIDFANGQFSGFAWGGLNIGWLSFRGANYGAIILGPAVSNLVNSFTPCVQSRIPTFSWQTSAAMPYDYQVRLCSNAGCTGANDPLVLEERLNTNSTSWAPACTFCCNILPYNNIVFGGVTYHGQVRARNPGGVWGSWSTASAFTTFSHCYPRADFLCDGVSCAGMPIHENAVVTLANNSTIHDGSPNPPACLWTLPAVASLEPGFTTSMCTIQVKFSAPPPGQRMQNITLTVTDTAAFSCSETKSLEVRFPLPEYREIPPIIWLRNFFVNFFTKIANVFAGF